MPSKEFNINDLVWAKMKGYPHWPGKITSPDADTKIKKNHHYVYFFGSNNYAWIADEMIEFHSEKMIEKFGQRKGELFQKAVQTIVEQSKNTPKYQSIKDTSKTSQEETKSEISNNESQPKNKTPLSTERSAQKIKKKLSVTKVNRMKTIVQEKKSPKKRVHSPDQSEAKRYFKSSTISISSTYESVSDRDSSKAETAMSVKKSVEQSHKSTVDLKQNGTTLEEKKIKPTNKKIGFLGLNHIGQGVVNNLHQTGHSLIIWNKTEEESKMFAEKIKVAATPAEVVKSADIIFSCMADPETAKGIIETSNGVLEGLEHSKTSKSYIELTPMDPKISQMIETDIKGKGGRYLEAQVCGSRIEACEGTLFIVAAGDKIVYDECRSCFDAISRRHMFISAEVGSASKLNAVNSMLTGTVYAAVAETLSLVNELGLKSNNLWDVLSHTTLFNHNIMHHLTSMIKRNYVTNTPLDQMKEEFNVGLSLADELAQRSKVFCYSNEVYKRAKMLKYGSHDISAVFEGIRPREVVNQEQKE